MFVLVRVTITVMKYHEEKKASGQRNSKQDKNLEARADAEVVEGRCSVNWLVYPGLLRFHSYRTQDSLPRNSTTHNELGPSCQSLIKNMP